jgi:hypothetical protein
MTRSRLANTVAAALVVTCVFTLAETCFGCPNCKDSLAGAAGESMNVARGYAISILIMLGMPFTLASCFGLYVWREMRRLKREGGSTGPSTPMRPLP